jgi:hypothetical protein
VPGVPTRIIVGVQPQALFCNSNNQAIITIRIVDAYNRPATLTGAISVRVTLNPALATSQTISLTQNTRVVRVSPAGHNGTVQVAVVDARDLAPVRLLQPGSATFTCNLTPS